MDGGGTAGAAGLEAVFAVAHALTGGVGAVLGAVAVDSGFAATGALGGVGGVGLAGAGAGEVAGAGVEGLACFFVVPEVGGWVGGAGVGVTAGDFWTGLADSADVEREVAFFFFLEASMMVFGLGTGAGGWGAEGGGGGEGGGAVGMRRAGVTGFVAVLRTGGGSGLGAGGADGAGGAFLGAAFFAVAAFWGAAAFFGTAVGLGAATFFVAATFLAGAAVDGVALAGALLEVRVGDAVFRGAALAALASRFLPETGRVALEADDFSGFMRAEEANLGHPEG